MIYRRATENTENSYNYEIRQKCESIYRLQKSDFILLATISCLLTSGYYPSYLIHDT